MSALDNHKLEYEDMPRKKIKVTRQGGKDSKMSKTSKVTESTPKKAYAPTRWEVAKTVIIFIMFTGIVAFVSGMHFQKSQEAEIRNAISQAQSAPVAEAKK